MGQIGRGGRGAEVWNREPRGIRGMEVVRLHGEGFNAGARSQGRKDAGMRLDCESIWHKMTCAAADGPGSGAVRRFVFHGVIMLR